MLDALELGWTTESKPLSKHLLDVQELRFSRTNQLTAMSEDHIKGAPYFVYHAILEDQRPFVSITPSRKDFSELRAISTKASIAWHALFNTPYTNLLVNTVADLQSDLGWYAGRFEKNLQPNKALALNTNAVILEAMHYHSFGPFLTNS